MRTPATPTARPPLPHALAGQSVLIIGGSSGIGLAAARLLGEVGAHVTLAGRDACAARCRRSVVGRASRANPYVALAIADAAKPKPVYPALWSRYRLHRRPPARAHSNALPKRYLGLDPSPGPVDEVRVR